MVWGIAYLIGCFWAGLRAVPNAVGVLISIAIWFAGLIPMFLIGALFKKLEAWSYKRSFAAIAAKRPPEGAV